MATSSEHSGLRRTVAGINFVLQTVLALLLVGAILGTVTVYADVQTLKVKVESIDRRLGDFPLCRAY